MAPCDLSAARISRGLESLAVKNIIAQDQCHVIAANKLLSDDEGLGQSIWFGLNGITNGNPHLAAVAQEALEIADIPGGGNQ